MNDLTWKEFERVDVRVGTILSAEEFKEAIKPAIKMTIDFGEEIGIKKSSAQITELYDKDMLLGKQILAVVNFLPRQIGPFTSEVLTLGVPNGDGHVVLVAPEINVENGVRLY